MLILQVTKHINAATRMVLDSLRTMVIWAFSMGVGWEDFCYVQIPGFILLLLGTMIYNELIRIPGLKYTTEVEADDAQDAEYGQIADQIEDDAKAGLLN